MLGKAVNFKCLKKNPTVKSILLGKGFQWEA